MAQVIKFKRGELVNVTDHVPSDGEPVYIRDLNVIRVGDGVKKVSELPDMDVTMIIDDTSVITDENVSQYATKAYSAKAGKTLEDRVTDIENDNVIDGGDLDEADDDDGNG